MARKSKASELSSELTPQPAGVQSSAANTLNIHTDAQDLNMTNTEESVSYAVNMRSRCGGALRSEREKQSLTVQDIASKLRLSAKQIDAIEADEFSKLPEPTIVRGFIRNYAKLLKINAEPLLDAYAVIVPSSAPYELTLNPSSTMHVINVERPKFSSYLLAGLAALLAFAVWLFYENYIAKPSPTKPSASIESLSNQSLEPLPESALPAAERLPELQASTELVLPPAISLPATVDAPIVSADTTAAPVTANSTPTAAAPLAPEPPIPAPLTPAPMLEPVSNLDAGVAKLEFNARQETWVSVTNAAGKTIYDKIIFAGSRETIEAKPPLNVTVGNAGATSLNMNGKAVNLAPYSRNNVARIKLE